MKKRIYLFAILFLALSFVACSSDDDPVILTISDSKLEMYSGNEMLLTATASAQWTSDNEFVAEVDESGKVTANHIGNATITASNGDKRAYCKVNVVPQYSLYADPILKFGCSQYYVKDEEKRTLIKKTSSYLSYEGENDNVPGIVYNFKNDQLTSVFVLVKHNYSSAMAEKLVGFLSERYAVAGANDGIYYFVNGPSGNFDMEIYLDPTYSENPRYAIVAYAPYERN